MSKGLSVSLLSGSGSAKNALDKAKTLLSGVKAGYETGVSRSLNRAVISSRASVTRTVRDRYTPKAKYVKRSLYLKKANPKNLEAAVEVRGSSLPLRAFNYRPKSDTTGNARKTVRVEVKKGGLKPLGASFVWKGLVLHRRGKSSLPVDTVYGPSVPSMAGNEDVSSVIEETMRESFLKNLEHETREILRSGTKRKK